MSNCMRATILMALLCLIAPSQLLAASEPSANEYQTAVRLYKDNKLAQAKTLLLRMLPKLNALKKKQKNKSKPYHLLSLGQADLYFYLAQIATKQNQPQTACRWYQSLTTHIKPLPKGWTKWAVQPHLPAQMKEAQQTFANQCTTLPSILQLTITPANASIQYQRKGGTWTKAQGTKLALPAGAVILKLEAPGHYPQQNTLQIKRWEVRKIQVKLKKRPPPKRRKLVIRRPPPIAKAKPKSVFATWWFWTITGTVVAGAAVGVVLALTLPRTYQVGPDGGTPLWTQAP